MEIQLTNQALEKKKMNKKKTKQSRQSKAYSHSIQMPALYKFQSYKKIMKLTKQTAFFLLFLKLKVK